MHIFDIICSNYIFCIFIPDDDVVDVEICRRKVSDSYYLLLIVVSNAV